MNRSSPRPHTSANKHNQSLPSISRTSSSSSQPRNTPRRDGSRMIEPVTPTPKKQGARRRGAPKSTQRKGNASELEGADASGSGLEAELDQSQGELDAGEEELFGLLGVTRSPPSNANTAESSGSGAAHQADTLPPAPNQARQAGVLAVSRADLEASSSAASPKSRPDPKRKADKKAAPGKQRRAQLADTDGTSLSESEPSSIPTPRSKGTSKSIPNASRAAASTSNPKPAPSKGRGKGANANPNVSSLSAQLAQNPPDPGGDGIPMSSGPSADSATAFDTTALSRSLPSSFFAPAPRDAEGSAGVVTSGSATPAEGKGKKGKGRKKNPPQSNAQSGEKGGAQAWDMPVESGPGDSQQLTWQQKLASYPHADSATPSRSSSTRKSNKSSLLKDTHADISTPTSNSTSSISSPLNPRTRPAHARRLSADSLLSSSAPHLPTSLSNPQTHVQGQGHPHNAAHARHSSHSTSKSLYPPSSYQPSLMDTLPPFNPAINANRAPQTPAKGGLAKQFQSQPLPLLPGVFPRLAGNSGMGAGSPGQMGQAVPGSGAGGNLDGDRYAGAKFHNSPAASSLPKPDLDDF